MRFLLTLSLLAASAAWAGGVRMLVQSSPLAGSQYHALAEVQPQLKVGDALVLVREQGNRHDPWAVRVEWQGRKLGYLPRAENRAVAAAMDQGERITARVARLADHPDPWQRVEIAVFAEL